MKVTKEIKEKADITIEVNSEKDIPLSGLPLAIAKSMLKYHKFYGYTNADTDKRVLLIAV